MELERLLQDNPLLWRGCDATSSINTIKTGFAELDAALPGGGWPANALVEIVTAQWGIGELRLLLPIVAQLSNQQYWVIWIAPPYIPYAQALEQSDVELSRTLVITPNDSNEALWSMEKILQAKACGMALAWPDKLTHRVTRRLQLAAEAGNSLGVIFQAANTETSPAAVRLQLSPADDALQICILKARGGYRRRTIQLKV